MNIFISRKMKRFLFIAFVTLACLNMRGEGTVIPFTQIPYNVNYHWGIINVNIAHGFVDIQGDGTTFHGTLDGVSIPWEGHVILVSDTLTIKPLDGPGLGTEQVVYQSGWYRRPKAKYFRAKEYNSSNPEIYKNLRGEGKYDASHDSMEAICVTSDMIAMFYYAHKIDFSKMEKGQQITLPIQGEYSQKAIITYNGPGSYSVEDTTYNTDDIEVEYSYEGKMSGYQVKMKFDKQSKIPVFISASLPVGRVEMLYNP